MISFTMPLFILRIPVRGMIVPVMQIRIMGVKMTVLPMFMQMAVFHRRKFGMVFMVMMEIIVTMHMDVLQFPMNVKMSMLSKDYGRNRQNQNRGSNDLDQ